MASHSTKIIERPLIRVGRGRIEITASSDDLERARQSYLDRHFIALPGLLEIGTINWILDRLATAAFEPTDDDHRYLSGLQPVDRSINSALSFLFNDPQILSFVRLVTNCGPIDGFGGRVLRFEPGGEHYVRWHDDSETGPHRVMTLRINLSRRPFRGGVLQFRRDRGEPVLSEYDDKTCGNAVLFRASQSLHRNTPILGGAAKTTFTGWFYRGNPVDKAG